jgi:tape measure domain-containing protein
MATTEEILRFVVQAEGQSEMGQLAKSMLDAGQAGEAASPEVQKLVEEFGRLSDLSGKVSALPALKAQLQSVGDQLFTAKQRAAELQTEFASTLEPTAALTRNYQKAQQAVAALENQQTQLGVAIKTSENALAAAGVSTENLDAADRQLQGQMAQTRAEALSLAAAHREAAAAGEAEALTMTEVAERSVVLRSAFEQLKVVLGTIGGFLALEEAKKQIEAILATGDKFKNFQIEFANAFGGADQGAEALEKVKQLAEQTPLSLDEVAKAALQARKEGLDPFNGSLLSLINSNERYGGSTEQLSGLIEGLGKAVNSGGISLKLLTSLQQAGIPAAQLLGDALGKTSTQIVDLAKKGQLGADSVQTLIDALNKNGADVAAQKMQTLGAQTQKVKDEFDDFLELIAKSGAYDFVVDKLKEINDAFKQGLESGKLQESAKSISDALIALGNALIGVTKFLVDHRAGILEAAEAYAVFRGALLATNLIEAGSNWVRLTLATKAHTVALGEAAVAQGTYATAAKSADAAAAAAAAGSGGLSKLSSLISAIPKNILIAVAVAGIEKDIELAAKLYDAIKGNIELNKQYNATEDEVIADRLRLVDISAGVTQKLKAFADTQIASEDQLAGKNRQQSQAYIDSLENATRYYAALRAQARETFDFKTADDATVKLKAFGIAIEEARTHLKILPEDIRVASKSVVDVANKFDELRAKGVAATTAIQGAFDDIEIITPKGLQTTIDIIKQMAIRGTEAKNAVSGELVAALQKLDGTDLRAFQENVSKKLAEATGNATELKTALGAALQAALLNVGLSAEQAGEHVTAAGQKIIGSFTDVATNANASSRQIQLAFSSALSKLTTSGEVEELEGQLKSAFDAGRISAAQFEAGMAAAGRKIVDIQTTAASAGEAFDGMGTEGTTAAQRVSLAWQSTRDDLAAQAASISADIAKALGSDQDANVDALKAKLKQVEAEIADYDAKIKAAGDSGKNTFDATTRGANQTAQATADAGKSADDAKQKYDQFQETGEEGFAQLVQSIANTRAGFLSLSQAAADFYDRTLKSAFDFATESDDAGAGFQRTAEAMAVAANETNKAIESQRSQLAGEIDQINQLGTDSNKSFGSFGNDADAASQRMGSLVSLIQQGKYEAGLLGQADLQPLQQALEAATQRAQQLADAAKSAAQQLADANNQLLDQLDDANGNAADKENRRYQQQLQQLKDLAAQAGAAGQAQYAQALKNAEDLHEKNLENIREENDAKNNTSSNTSTNSSSSNARGSSGGGIGSGGAPTNRSGASLVPINIHINGVNQTDDQLYGTSPTARVLADLLSAKANSI